MNVHISYKGQTATNVEADINKQIEKLGKRLQIFRPDLVHLRVGVDYKNQREGFAISLDLRLPSGDIAAQETGDPPAGVIRKAFADLIERLGKHKDLLRAHHKWIRRRTAGRGRSQPEGVPFEETVAAVRLESISNDDVDHWVNANLYRLSRFVDRELHFRESNGQIEPGQVTREEVVNETIARALGDGNDKPEKVSIEPWLFHLARVALNDMVERSPEESGDVHVQDRDRVVNFSASDEDRLQYYQPDETPLQQDNIADRGAPTPEQIAESDEVLAMMNMALQGAHPEDREAFLLYVLEGFTVDEIAVISSRKPDEVRRSVGAAREHLRRFMPGDARFKQQLLRNSRIA